MNSPPRHLRGNPPPWLGHPRRCAAEAGPRPVPRRNPRLAWWQRRWPAAQAEVPLRRGKQRWRSAVVTSACGGGDGRERRGGKS
jgi:hypothetical protein